MGSEIFYCSACKTLLRGRDFEKGKAFRFADRVSCDGCVDQVLGPIPPDEKARLIASARATAGGSAVISPTPPGPDSTKTRIPTRASDSSVHRHAPPTSRTPREALPAASAKGGGGGLWIGIGVGAALLVVVGIAASSSSRPPVPRTDPRPPFVELTPELPSPPPPPPEPRPDPRPRPPTPRRDESAKKLLDDAKAYAASKPDDLQGQLERASVAAMEAANTPLAEEARTLADGLRKRLKEKAEADLAALDAKIADAVGREAFVEATQALAALKLAPELAKPREAKIDEGARARWGELRAKLETARRKGSAAEARAIADRVRAWQRPAVTAELEKDLAAAVEVELPKELVEYRKRWSGALALLLPFDYAAALAELAKPAEGAAKEEAAADLQSLQLAAEAAREASALVSRWTRGTDVKLDRLEGGLRTPIEGKVWKASPLEVEVAGASGLEVLPLTSISAASLAELFVARSPKKPTDPLAAALLCALEGDVEGAARFGVALPEKFKAAAAAIAAERQAGPEADARNLLADAEHELQAPATRLNSAARYAALLQAHAGTKLVRRLKPFLDARLDQSRETLLGADHLAPAGSFRWLEAGKERPESYVSAAELPPDKAVSNYVEVELHLPADPALRAWAYVGACCQETASLRLQAPELSGGTAKEPLSCEPGSPHALPVKITFSLRAKHSAHGGPKEPSRWFWTPLPLPKYASAGPRKIRLVTDQQGFAVAYVYLSAGRSALPRDADLREHEKQRAALDAAVAPATIPTGSISRDFWANVSGWQLADLTSNPAFPDRPSGGGTLSILEGPIDAMDNYGSRIRGYVHPPANGNYVFFVASDDESEVWLSTDDSPARKRSIMKVLGATRSREWDAAVAKKSEPIALRAGRRYYIEVLHKDGGGGDHVAVGWQLPDGALERPIPGNRLSPWGSGPAPRVKGRPGALYRAIALNSPAATIDGIAWEGKDAPDVVFSSGDRFENFNVPLSPPVDDAKARMIRSSYWNRNGVDFSVANVPPGTYSVYLYIWEDTVAQTFDILVNDTRVRQAYSSGPGGHWERLGPWPASPGPDGRIRIRTTPGDANLSGIEIWRATR